ncbi:MAG TPA: FAD-binding oxidoreductase [Bacillus bacterium]|uniref:D-nopaline dehydrogenase n=1 Tax=Siminovitchia fordii TaxID=254759 RepID=A0ABQ4K6W8_9BACI|nr:FAD-binding oxidoreductase [Siminovitchia fordii]GIN20927.1 D-nopaline dehydrogenase [Siminovitchia fordii]HBZ12093.1 FAD-binding oxidoreductase [Bacillus sp. (in: firmicutes)]
MKNQYDVVIIGSGVIGSSIAFHLSESKQKEILVIDQSYPLSGTSGSTQAWVWVHSKTPSWYGELSMLSAELYPFLERKIGDVEYKRTGGIAPFFDESDRERALLLAEQQAEVGIEIEVLNREQVLEKEPALSPKIAGATFSKLDGNVNPFRMVDLYLKAAKKNHVQFSFYNPVIEINRNKGMYEIVTAKESFVGKQIILAAGPWTKEVGKLLGVYIPVKQVRGQILITEPLAPLIKHTIGGMRQADNGEILIGYSKEEVGYDRRTTLDIIQDTAKMAVDFLPDLARANIVRCFSGIRVMTYDGFPIVGKIPSMENAYITVMHSGITLSPLIGTLMTELLEYGETSISLKNLRLDRFQEFRQLA